MKNIQYPILIFCLLTVTTIYSFTYYQATFPQRQTFKSDEVFETKFATSSPYKQFGDNSLLLTTEQETINHHVIEIPIKEDTLAVKLVFDFKTGSAKFFDKENQILEEFILPSDAVARFLRPDRFAEKYLNLTPYGYAANNPIYYVDINGDSLWVKHKNNNYLYNSGTLYLNGSEYTGKVKGFLKQTVNALSIIGSKPAGEELISELQGSKNNFYIDNYLNNTTGSHIRDNEFEKADRRKAYAQQYKTDPTLAKAYQNDLKNGLSFDGGSGGTIYWVSSGEQVVTTKGIRSSTVTGLAHEMFHALDANRGLSKGGNHLGIPKNEWQAIYNENVLRSQVGYPLRTHYIGQTDPSGILIRGSGTRTLTPNNEPLKPSWYQ